MSVLDSLEFAPMHITDVFESMTSAGKWFDLSKATRNGDPEYPYVARSGDDNGIVSYLPHQGFDAPNNGNAITIGVSTSTVFYQPVSFYTGKEIQVLHHPRLTAVNGPVLVTILREQMMKFKWGNGASLVRLRATRIMVPVTTDDNGNQVVDWDGLDRLGAELLDRIITRAHSAIQTGPADDDTLPELRFEPMLMTEVFDEYRQAPAWLNTNQVIDGEIKWPHVTNTALGNSVSGFIAGQALPPNPGNAITVGIDTQVVAYQPVPFYGATKVYELRAEAMNEFSAMLLVTALGDALKSFSWGYKASATRLKKTRIMVPVTADDNGNQVVDWDGMTAYGHALRVRAERNLAPALEVSREPQA